jgi:hypothetical protein
MAQKFVKKWFQPGEIDGEIVKIKEGQSLKAMEGSSEVDLIKIESGKVMLKGAEAALQSDISALESDIEAALVDAKSYADGKISDLVNGAPVALDTLKELADKLGEEESALNALIVQVDENLQDAKDYTDQKISEIPAVDLSGYYTKSEVDSEVSSLESSISQEVSDRQAADAAEILARNAAISVAVTAEQQAREAFDGMLDAKIDQEISDRQAADTALSGTISSTATSLMGTIGAVNDRALAAEGELDGRLDTLEPKVTAIETDMSDLEGYNLDLRSDLDQEISDRAAADTAKLAEAKAYTDSKIAAIPSTDLSGFYTKSEVDSKESALDSKISTEKGRVDAILSASSADKDTFAEIVQLINQVDTTNDQAFAGYALANDAAVEALDGRLDVAEPKISTLESKVSTLESEMDQAQSDLGSLDGRLDVAEPKISSLESNMSSAQSNISTLQGKVSTLESKMSTAESDISAAKSDISALETQVASIMGVVEPVVKEDEEIVPSVLTHVDLEKEALKIYKLCVGRVPVFKNVDYSVSVVSGKTRITWIGDMASGGSHAIALSDKVYCTYLHAGSVPDEGGGGSGGGSQTFTTWNPKAGHTLNSEGGVEFVGPYQDWVTSSLEMSGDFEFTYELNSAPFEPHSAPYSNCQIGLSPKSWKDSGYPFPKFGISPQGGGAYGPKKWNYASNGSVTLTEIGSRGISDKLTFKKVGNDLQILVNDVLGLTIDVTSFNEPFVPAVGYLTTGEAILKSYKV